MSPQKSTERKRTERKRTEIQLSENAPDLFKRKHSRKNHLVRKSQTIATLCE